MNYFCKLVALAAVSAIANARLGEVDHDTGDAVPSQPTGNTMVVDKTLTGDKMTDEKMTVDKIMEDMVDKQTGDKMTGDKMTGDKMTGDKMTDKKITVDKIMEDMVDKQTGDENVEHTCKDLPPMDRIKCEAELKMEAMKRMQQQITPKTSICSSLSSRQRSVCEENFDAITKAIKLKDCSPLPDTAVSVCNLLAKFQIDGGSLPSADTIASISKVLCENLTGEQKLICEKKCDQASDAEQRRCEERKEILKSVSSCSEDSSATWCKVSRPDSSTSEKADCNARSWKAMSDRQVAFCCARSTPDMMRSECRQTIDGDNLDSIECSDASIARVKQSISKVFCCANRQLSYDQCKETGFGDAAQIDCEADNLDTVSKSTCCLNGRLSDSTKCEDFGLKESLPSRCKDQELTTVDDSLGLEANLKRIACRAIVKDEDEERTKQERMDRDPRRDNDAVAEKIKDLGDKGEKCVENLQLSIDAIKTLVEQWRGDPTARTTRDVNVLKQKTVAEIFQDAIKATIGAQEIQDSFDADTIDDTTNELLPREEVDSDKPAQCQDEWTVFKNRLANAIAKFNQFPNRFKALNLKSASIAFSSLDMGSIDWSDARNTCRFAQKLVSDIKEVKSQLVKKLNLARADICEGASQIVVGTVVGNIAKCMRQARGNSTEADRKKNAEVYNRVKDKADTIFSTLKRKCVAKANDGNVRRFEGKTKRKLQLVLKGLKALNLTAIKTNVEKAVRQNNPDAEDIVVETILERTRRRLDESVKVQVELSNFGAPPNPDYEGAIAESTGASAVIVTDDAILSAETSASPEDINDTSEIPTYPEDDEANVSSGNVNHVAVCAVMSMLTFTRILL